MKRDLFGFFVPMCALLADVPMSLARHNGEPLGDLPGIWMAQQMGLASVGEAMALGVHRGCRAPARPNERGQRSTRNLPDALDCNAIHARLRSKWGDGTVEQGISDDH